MTKKTETTDLIVLETLNAKDIFSGEGEKDGVQELLTKVKAMAVPELDPDTKEGREELRSLAYKIAQTKTGVDKLGKDYVAELKKVTSAVDAQRRTWREQMEALQESVRKPLTDFENAEKERVAKHNAQIDFMRNAVNFDFEPTSKDVSDRLVKVEEAYGHEFEEFEKQAETVYQNTIGRLGEKLAAIIKAEKDAEELARLKAAEAERLEKERIEKIRQEERAKAEAALKAEREKEFEKASEPAPVEHVNDTNVADIPKPANDTNVVSKLTPEQEHKRKVNRSIVAALSGLCMLTDGDAKAVVTAIAKGNVPNVTINY